MTKIIKKRDYKQGIIKTNQVENGMAKPRQCIECGGVHCRCKPVKICWIDVETTGLDPVKNGLVQIAALVEIDGTIQEEFCEYIRPFRRDVISDKALEVNKLTRKQLKDFPEPEDVHRQLVVILDKYVDRFDKTDKFFFGGYNAQAFDAPFMRSWFHKNGDTYYGSYFFSNTMDVLPLASYTLRKRRPWMLNFKLETVASTVGIDVDKSQTHHALYDIMLTRAIYQTLTQEDRKHDGTKTPDNEVREATG